MNIEKISNKIASDLLSSKVTTGNFWKVVESFDWGSDNDDGRIKKMLLKDSTQKFADSFRDIYLRYYSTLDKQMSIFLKDQEPMGLGDDGYNDLLSHIIGLGKSKYNAVMKNPNIAYKMGLSGDNPESFIYSIPYADDWKDSKSKSIDYKTSLKLWNKVNKSLGDYFKFVRDEGVTREILEDIQDGQLTLASSIKKIKDL